MKSPGHDKSRQFSSCSFTLRLSAPLDVSPQVTTCNNKALRNRPVDRVDFTVGFHPITWMVIFFDPISVSSPGFAICKQKKTWHYLHYPNCSMKKKLTNVSLSTNHHHPPSFMLLDPQYQPCHCLTARQTLHCWGGSFEHRATPPSSLRCTSMTIGKYGLPRSFPGYWGRGSVVSYIFLFVTQWTNLFDLGTIRRRAWIRRRVSALKCRQKSSQWVASVKCSSSFRSKTQQKNGCLKEKPI